MPVVDEYDGYYDFGTCKRIKAEDIKPNIAYVCPDGHEFRMGFDNYSDIKDTVPCATCGKESSLKNVGGKRNLLIWYDVNKKRIRPEDIIRVGDTQWEDNPYDQAMKKECEAYEYKINHKREMGKKEAAEYKEYIRHETGWYKQGEAR
jgi:hypothetical protein